MNQDSRIEPVTRARFDEAVAVLCDAFFDYPVMRFVIGGEAGADYPRRLRQLVSFFTVARFLRDDLVLSVREKDRLVGVVNLNRPNDDPGPDSRAATDAPWRPEPPGELEDHRLALWEDLGDSARKRYESYGEATASYLLPEPRFHLGMIGVLRTHARSGMGRRLLDHVHALSKAHPSSVGVSLTTEDPDNLPLYEHFGYRVVAHVPLGGIETWGLFRHDP